MTLPAAVRRPYLALLIPVLAALAAWGVHRLVEARRAAAAARILPADSLLYLEVRDSAALLAALRDAPLAALHPGWLDSPLPRWLARSSRPAALALWKAGDGSRRSWAVVSDARAGERSLMAALARGAGSEAGTARRHGGDAYTRLGGGEGEALCVGRVGRSLVIASDEPAYLRVLDIAAGGASLAASGLLERGRRHLDGGEGVLLVYVGPSLLRFEGSFEGAALAVRLGPLGWMERFHLMSDPSSPPLLVELLRRPPCAPDPGGSLPADADLVVSVCAGNLEDLYEPLVEALADGEAAAGGWGERLRGVEQLTGLGLKRELLGALGRRHAAAFWWKPDGGSPASVVSLEIERPEMFSQVLECLGGFGRATGRLRSEQVRDHELKILAGQRGAPAFAWTLDGSRFLLSRDPERLEETLRGIDEGHVKPSQELKEHARRLAPGEVNLFAVQRGRPSPAFLWARGGRDGVSGEVHAPRPVLLERVAMAVERWREDQKPRAK